MRNPRLELGEFTFYPLTETEPNNKFGHTLAGPQVHCRQASR